jgi:hypothetical protein
MISKKPLLRAGFTQVEKGYSCYLAKLKTLSIKSKEISNIMKNVALHVKI